MSRAASGVERRALALSFASCDELAGQLVERLLFPGGLRLGDDGLFHQHRGKRGNALKGGTQQVKAGKAQKTFQRAGKRAESGGKIRDLGAGGGNFEVIVGFCRTA